MSKYRSPPIVGLTGGIGSGKSSVAELFRKLGIDVIDTDEIAHTLTQPGGIAIEPIRQTFGEHFFLQDGTLDRTALRKLVFTNSQAKQQLESILHPLIYQQTLRRIPSIRSGYGILVVPLLLETRVYRKITSRILVVDCSEELQISRTMMRSKISREEVLAIMANQFGRKERIGMADDVILNDSDLHNLAGQVNLLHSKYSLLLDYAAD